MDGSQHDGGIHDERKVPNVIKVILQFPESVLDIGPVGVVDLGPTGHARTNQVPEVVTRNLFLILVGVTKTEPLRELVWESRKDPDHERQEIHD